MEWIPCSQLKTLPAGWAESASGQFTPGCHSGEFSGAHRTRKHIVGFFVDSLDSPLLVRQLAMHVTHIKAFRSVRLEGPSKALLLPLQTASKPPKIAPKRPHFVMSKILTVTAENSLCELPLVLIDSN
jgi:hypothetical protein